LNKHKDRDFIETKEGLIFCVVGYLHPPDRYTAYLKYIPSLKGKWRREGIRYKRTLPYYHLSQMENTYKFLKKTYPEYIYDCPVRNIEISSVPKDRVKRYYPPRERIAQLIEEGPDDSLEDKLLNLIYYITENTSLNFRDFGVTGSILTETHNPDFSDIDLTVYGLEATLIAKNFLISSKDQDVISSIGKNHKQKFLRTRSDRFPLEINDLKQILERRWNFGIYKGTYFSIHPIRRDKDITETYGEKTYNQLGVISGTSKISDDQESHYLPSIYGLKQTSGEGLPNLKNLVSYESLFSGVFYQGEKIDFRGVLEEVKGPENFYRVVIGAAGYNKGYVRLS